MANHLCFANHVVAQTHWSGSTDLLIYIGVSLGGALKNIIALAAGFVVGKEWGDNAKAAVMRVGLLEMRKFGKMFFENSVRTATFTEESAGVADLITSCSSGRNYRCAKMSVERRISIAEVEKEELNGQMLQGTSTAKEVFGFLEKRGKVDEFPLLTGTYRKYTSCILLPILLMSLERHSARRAASRGSSWNHGEESRVVVDTLGNAMKRTVHVDAE